jgi:hypothetical protein
VVFAHSGGDGEVDLTGADAGEHQLHLALSEADKGDIDAALAAAMVEPEPARGRSDAAAACRLELEELHQEQPRAAGSLSPPPPFCVAVEAVPYLITLLDIQFRPANVCAPPLMALCGFGWEKSMPPQGFGQIAAAAHRGHAGQGH